MNLLLTAGLLLTLLPAHAAPCPGNADALGTARVLDVDVAVTPRVGRRQFRDTLPLAPKEVVLTFDDGPWPATTGRVLDALEAECVRATFFLIGRNALSHPALARRELALGHTVGYHSFSHPRLDLMATATAQADIERGMAAVDAALYGPAQHPPSTAFFRFPYFASTAPLLDWLERRRTVVFGADLWASDWNPMTPQQELARTRRGEPRRHRAVPRHQGANRRHAAGLPARPQGAWIFGGGRGRRLRAPTHAVMCLSALILRSIA